MNVIDYVVLGVIALSVLWGFYRGFVQTVLNVGGCLLSIGGSFLLYPRLASLIQNNQGIVKSLVYFTDAGSRVGDLEMSLTGVSSLTDSTITTIIGNVNLPAPLDTLLSYNLQNKVYEAIGASTVSDYVNQTIISVSVNILCFLLCFLILYLVVSVIINLIKSVFHFPVLKQLDWLVGGLFGAVRGVVIAYVLFTVMPLLVTVVPFEQFATLVNESQLAGVFQNGSMIISIMNGKL